MQNNVKRLKHKDSDAVYNRLCANALRNYSTLHTTHYPNALDHVCYFLHYKCKVAQRILQPVVQHSANMRYPSNYPMSGYMRAISVDMFFDQ